MSALEIVDRNPDELADDIVAAHAGETAWLDAFAQAIARRRSGRELDRFLSAWGLSRSMAAVQFGVSRQAVSKWLSKGVPQDRLETVAQLSAATDLLERYLKRDRIPAVVRRPVGALDGRSLVELLGAGRGQDILAACRAMFDFERVGA